jgi:hypothetical protein
MLRNHSGEAITERAVEAYSQIEDPRLREIGGSHGRRPPQGDRGSVAKSVSRCVSPRPPARG